MGKSKKEKRQAYFFDNKALLALILPLVVEQLLAVLVGMADSIMIASVGEAAVSGVSLVDQIMVLLINAFSALATGGAVVAGQFLGQDRREEACKSATQMVWFITICAIGITVLVYLGKSFILHTVFGKIDQDVMHHADIYLLIVAASIPFMALYNGGAAIFRTMGNSKVTMQISIIMNVINIGGNAILIYGFHRGTEGVAIPTLVSRMTAAIIIIVLLCDEKRTLHIERTWRYRINWEMVKKILSIGVPNGLENSMFQLGKIIVLSLVSTFGTYAIAANAVSNAIALFQILPGMAITLAITPVISRCVGAGDYEQTFKYDLRQHIMMKLLIFGIIDMVIVILLSLMTKSIVSLPLYQILVYVLVPYNIVCIILFSLITIWRKQLHNYFLWCISGSICVAVILIANIFKIYEIRMLYWGIAYFITTTILGIILYSQTKIIKWEVASVWN